MAKGLCELHYHRQYTRLKNGSLAETPAAVLPEPHWAFECPEGEAELMERYKETEKQSKESSHA
jgi:hypothetical protein